MPPAGPRGDPVTALGWLHRAGIARPVGTIGEPLALAHSLRQMAAVADLPDARFLAIAPDRGGTSRPTYTTLYAWLDALRFRTLADDQGPWWGLEYAAGLINTLLVHRGCAARIAIAVEGHTWFAVAAPPEALSALQDASLIDWARLPDPRLDTGL